MSEGGRVLAVFAHPDDETYGPGATLARLAAEGAEVRLVTMTRGENASMGDSPLYSPDLLAEVRERELECACRALGVANHELLALPDGRLARVAEGDLAAPVLAALKEFRPTLVITFHPNGISGHEDHRTVSKMVRNAIEYTAPKSSTGRRQTPARAPRLAYYAVPTSVAEIIKWRRIHSVPDEDLTHAVETGEYIEAKARAAECHKTQRYLLEKLSAGRGGIERIWRTECFIVQGESPAKPPREMLTP